MKNNIVWVDTVRAFGIFLVYLYHCEFYFGENTYELSIWYIPFFMAIFYFVSGYLFFMNKTVDLKKKINSICAKQLWPYFIFCSLIYFPKQMARGGYISFVDYAKQIVTGSASWFIASLIVLQILVIVSYRWIRKPSLYMLIGGGYFANIYKLRPEWRR